MSNFVNLLDIVYPIGSVMLLVSNSSPAEMVGGTWVQVEKDTFLCSGVPLTTGGSNWHSLVTTELPGTVWVSNDRPDAAIKIFFNPGTLYGINTSPSVTEGSAFSIMPKHMCVYIWYRTS